MDENTRDAAGLRVLKAVPGAREFVFAEPTDPLGPEARSWLGQPTPAIVAAVEEKRRYTAAVPAHWPSDPGAWSAVRARLAPELERFDAVEGALDAAGIPSEPGYLEIDEGILNATFRYATRLRARWTVVDLLESQHALDPAQEAALPWVTKGPAPRPEPQ
jgi:hypothetical protein